MYNIKENSLI